MVEVKVECTRAQRREFSYKLWEEALERLEESAQSLEDECVLAKKMEWQMIPKKTIGKGPTCNKSMV